MKVTGYKLREAIKQWELRKDAASRIFDDVLKIFPDEKKEHPSKIIDDYTRAEESIAHLQEAQSIYNLAVLFDFEGKQVTLSYAVKALGGLARVEKLWRAASGAKKEKWERSGSDERDPAKQYAVFQVTPTDAVKASTVAAKRASTLRAGIAQGNAQEREINVTADLFE